MSQRNLKLARDQCMNRGDLMLTADEAFKRAEMARDNVNDLMVNKLLENSLKSVGESAKGGFTNTKFETEGFASKKELKIIVGKLRDLGYRVEYSMPSDERNRKYTIYIEWGKKSLLKKLTSFLS